MNKIIISIILTLLTTLVDSQIKTYNYPPEAPNATDFRLWVQGKEVFIYDTPVAAMATFESQQQVDVKIRAEHSFTNVDIRPKNLGIIPQIKDNYILFKLPVNTKVSVEFDNKIHRPLFVFSQTPIAKDVKKSADIIFEAGKMYKAGFIQVKSGQTVFIEGGAVVEGYFHFYDTKNVTITGHGIIDNREQDRSTSQKGIMGVGSSNFNINSIHIIGSPQWTVTSFGCDNFTINDIRIIGWRPCDDGIDIVGCENVIIKNSFIRSKDDCIVIKGKVINLPTQSSFDKNNFDTKIGCKRVDNILITNNVLWNADWGNAFEIGFETRGDVFSNIKFIDNDIIHVEANGGVFTIHNGDRATITDVIYKDIRIEDARGFLCHFQILNSHYTRDLQRGQCRNITLNNIQVMESVTLNSLITGYDKNHTYENILFKDVFINGQKVESLFSGNIFTEYTHNIRFE